jgi:hypothetical protein
MTPKPIAGTARKRRTGDFIDEPAQRGNLHPGADVGEKKPDPIKPKITKM